MASEINLSKNLIYLLAEEKCSLTLAARKAKMHKSTLHGYLSGVVPRGLENLVLLARYFDISPGEMIFGDLCKPRSKTLCLNSLLNEDNSFEIIIRPLKKRS